MFSMMKSLSFPLVLDFGFLLTSIGLPFKTTHLLWFIIFIVCFVSFPIYPRQMAWCPHALPLIKFEPAHEIMVLFILRKHILQTRMRSHPDGLDV